MLKGKFPSAIEGMNRLVGLSNESSFMSARRNQERLIRIGIQRPPEILNFVITSQLQRTNPLIYSLWFRKIEGTLPLMYVRNLWFLLSTHMLCFSASYPSYKTIYWGVWRGVNLTATCMKTFQMRTTTHFGSWGRKFTRFKLAASFTPPMIYSGNQTRSTLERTLTLCSDLQKQKKGLRRLIGMQGSLASVMPIFGLNEWISQMLGRWSGWIFFGCAGLEGARIHFRFSSGSFI